MQKSRLSGIVEAQEKQLGVLVQQTEIRKNIVDWIPARSRSALHTWMPLEISQKKKTTEQWRVHTPVNDPHGCDR